MIHVYKYPFFFFTLQLKKKKALQFHSNISHFNKVFSQFTKLKKKKKCLKRTKKRRNHQRKKKKNRFNSCANTKNPKKKKALERKLKEREKTSHNPFCGEIDKAEKLEQIINH